jgi:hypothetical protein
LSVRVRHPEVYRKMTIQWLSREDAENAGAMEERVLLEQTPNHYPEFEVFLENEFQKRGGELFFRGRSGIVYRVGWLSEANPEGLKGIEIRARFGGGNESPVSENIDLDLWPFLEWLIEGVGGEWTLSALRTTGSIYKAPGAAKRG